MTSLVLPVPCFAFLGDGGGQYFPIAHGLLAGPAGAAGIIALRRALLFALLSLGSGVLHLMDEPTLQQGQQRASDKIIGACSALALALVIKCPITRAISCCDPFLTRMELPVHAICSIPPRRVMSCHVM